MQKWNIYICYWSYENPCFLLFFFNDNFSSTHHPHAVVDVFRTTTFMIEFYMKNLTSSIENEKSIVFTSFFFSLSLTFFTFPSILKIHIVNLVYNYSNANELYQHLNTSRLHLSIWLGFGLIWLDLTWLHSTPLSLRTHIVNLINLFICLSLF